MASCLCITSRACCEPHLLQACLTRPHSWRIRAQDQRHPSCGCAGDKASTAASIARSAGILRDSEADADRRQSNGHASASGGPLVHSVMCVCPYLILAECQPSKRSRVALADVRHCFCVSELGSPAPCKHRRALRQGCPDRLLARAEDSALHFPPAHAQQLCKLCKPRLCPRPSPHYVQRSRLKLAGRTASTVLEGQDFREQVTRPDGSVDKDKFWQLWPDLRVLARCNPTDKLIIVRGALLGRLGQYPYPCCAVAALLLRSAEAVETRVCWFRFSALAKHGSMGVSWEEELVPCVCHALCLLHVFMH